MLTKPDRRTLKSLYSFSVRDGWDDVSKFLQGELDKLHEALESSLDEAKFRQLQGRAQFAREFLDLVADAPKILEKLRESSL